MEQEQDYIVEVLKRIIAVDTSFVTWVSSPIEDAQALRPADTTVGGLTSVQASGAGARVGASAALESVARQREGASESMCPNETESDSEVRDHAWEFRSDEEAAEIDDTLWWAVGRREMIRNLMKRALRERPIESIVEIGCGSGGDLPVLARYGAVTGVERSPTLARRARQRCVANEIIEADFFDLERPRPADLHCLFDVLEHIEDDAAFVERIAEHGDSGQLLLLSVPACPRLYSRHDALLHHYRRYRGSEVVALLERSGFEVLQSSYFVFLLFPMVALSRIHEMLLSALGRAPQEVRTGEVPGWLNAILVAVLRFEARVARFVRLPIGVWFFALARRR